ncbi:unnamed protein product [Brassica rapa]|uniref:Uncharacterized protein n=1 Tax=Brassica campestris TaxID=3711 RepID=A0A8D9HPD1_BRACM|nr:unnamed protein product [Brassica rapa]
MGYRNIYFGFMLYSIQILYICLIRYFHMLIYTYIVIEKLMGLGMMGWWRKRAFFGPLME